MGLSETHIVPVVIGDPLRCKALTDALLDEFGIYVQPINYPTVPKGSERIRLTPGPLHGPAEIEALGAAMEKLWLDFLCRAQPEATVTGRKSQNICRCGQRPGRRARAKG